MYFNPCNSILISRFALTVALSLVGVASAESQCNVQQFAKLLPDDGAAEDGFSGAGVSISGSTAIVGADRHDHGELETGAAYLFDTTTGNQLAELLPDDIVRGNYFGGSVGISGNIAIVGAPSDDDNGFWAGSAYLFDTTTGQQLAEVFANDGKEKDYFGTSVAISGMTAVVGSSRFGSGGNARHTGAAYVFDIATGQQTFKFLPDDGTVEGDWFGRKVAISGTTAIVGSFGDDHNGYWSGSAYLFDTTTGNQIAKLLPNDGAAEDQFGRSVAIDGNIAIVGAYGNDDNGDASGSAYLFDATTGQQIAKLTPDDGLAEDWFGFSVAISGTTAIVSAHGVDDNGDRSGAAYVFDIATGNQLAKFSADDNSAGDNFSRAVAISGTTAIVGARNDDDNGEDSGSAYVFDISSCTEPTVVLPDSFLVTRGTYVSGAVTDLSASDNADLSIRRSIPDIQSRTEFEVKAVSPAANPAALDVTLEGSVFARSQVNQTIELYDYVAGVWEQIDTREATRFTDSTVTVAATGDLSRFVEAGTLCIEARIRYQSPVARQQFSSSTDQFIWTIGQ